MTDDRFDPSHGRGTQLVLHRPAALTAGALRRIHVHLDGQHITDLARRLPVCAVGETCRSNGAT